MRVFMQHKQYSTRMGSIPPLTVTFQPSLAKRSYSKEMSHETTGDFYPNYGTTVSKSITATNHLISI